MALTRGGMALGGAFRAAGLWVVGVAGSGMGGATRGMPPARTPMPLATTKQHHQPAN